MPIRVRLTLWYAALLTAIVAALAGFLVVQLRADLEAVLDRELRGRSAQIVAEFEEEVSDEVPGPGVAKDFRNLCAAAAPGQDAAAQLFGAGAPSVTCGHPGHPAPVVPADARGGSRRLLTVPATRGDDRWRALAAPTTGPGGATGAIVVAESLQPVDAAVDRVLILVLLAGPAALAATALGGWWLARRALRPVERMTSRAREIGIERLHERVPVPRVEDEIGRLGVTLNAMLDRLQRGLDEKHRLVADASHGLRTPLAVMRAELDVSLREDALPEAARDVLESACEEIDKMTRTVDNLLTLAQVDEGRLAVLTTRVELRQAVESAAEPLRPLADERHVRLALSGPPCAVQADVHRLQQALTNFIDNAIRFAREGGEVEVMTWCEEAEVGVTVIDDGPGIPIEVRDRVFDRFYRVAGGPHETGGSGLGLAICREIADAHGGRVWIDSAPGGGSAFSIALPADGPGPVGSDRSRRLQAERSA